MFKRIVVTLDGSTYSECALDSAEALARSLGIKLVLLHVIPYPKVYDGGVESDYERRLRKYLGEKAQTLRNTGLEVEFDIPWGEVVPVIVDYVASDDKTLLVMASHGRTGLTRLAFGSVAEGVLKRARSTPTLVCRCPAETAQIDAA
jgi:nucleotide-binding universal stress UspA family protein